jgi:hypothetical protein
MGFNIEQYEMYDNDSYSNAMGYGCELIIRKDKRKACEEARDARKGNVVASEETPDEQQLDEQPANKFGAGISKLKQLALKQKAKNALISNPNVASSNAAPLSSSTTPEKSKTGMYIGIGVGVLAIGVIAFFLIKRK